MERRDIGLTDREREHLAGPPHGATEADFGGSALVFCIVLLICALIAGASRIIQADIEAAAPDAVGTPKKTPDVFLWRTSPMRAPPDR